MLSATLTDILQAKNISTERFREITNRLFSQGIVVRDEDGVEEKLYDDALRIEDALTDFFHLAGFRLVHSHGHTYFRLYAPGAQVPGEVEDGLEEVPGLRAKLSADFVALALALRFHFNQGLCEGGSRLTDTGEVLVRFEELATTLQTQLKRQLPATVTDKLKLLAELKRHRLITYAANFSVTDEDAYIAIRPTILGIVSNEVLEAALEADDAEREAAGAEAADAVEGDAPVAEEAVPAASEGAVRAVDVGADAANNEVENEQENADEAR
ncbi:DUF4194 domain-containing protein [Paraburkholderia sp. UCT31]|uniref:DUF4194 domain-containing protein n=1 Tax=Paraburkholderia sp. UCT31 TaxID=2615209 RepID=UPI001655565E|nr:DUF4194 domain-containing protein [Paraburkholderia sp. UCT31]MBC8738509.1 DUF4194 domain-containing protein [Paraburkholderia sp. UCT31]